MKMSSPPTASIGATSTLHYDTAHNLYIQLDGQLRRGIFVIVILLLQFLFVFLFVCSMQNPYRI